MGIGRVVGLEQAVWEGLLGWLRALGIDSCRVADKVWDLYGWRLR